MTQKQMDKLSLVERAKLPTPGFFQRLQLAGLMLTAIAATLLTTPTHLPGVVVNIAGYLAVAGAVVSAVSQVAVKS